ncbi:hypothetical protein BC936DRAFT_142060 [Jimgerdemannia flammicorona]|uniref:DASH complex subunit Hsk3 like-domain-containing protein n=1 Tax=Jimgerdemannia flammicorona TaxID=994334 RepID=A0A433A1A8_9FUNG|nr:hypothetical protein BC936DRAFT_142060 [Jimgerdemannia flammicorona]
MADNTTTTTYHPSISATSKSTNYAVLNQKLEQLQQNLDRLQVTIEVTTQQVPYLRQMGSIHASTFMAASRVLNEDSGNTTRG